MKKSLFITCSLFFTFCQAQNFEWAKHIGGSGFTRPTALTTDNSGNVYGTGYSDAITYFDLPSASPVLNPSTGGTFAYVTKSDSSGNYTWVKMLGGPSSVFPLSITVDDAGNVYSCGFFTDTTDFDPGPGVFNLGSSNSSTPNSYISKLDAAGNFVWAKKIDGGLNYAFSLALDNSNNLFLSGYFKNTADLDPGAAVNNFTSAGDEDIFLIELDPAGNYTWAKQIGSTGLDRANGVVADPSGNAIITGRFQLTVDFDPGAGTTSFTAAGSDDAFTAKFDPAGNFLWAKPIQGTMEEYGNAITADSSGNTYVAGLFNSSTNFDPGATNLTLGSYGYEDVFVARYSPSGNLDWLKRMGGTGSDYPNSIDYASSSIYLGGYFSDYADFDPGAGVYGMAPSWSGMGDVFITKLDLSGNLSWAAQLGGNYDEYGGVAAVDTFNNVYTSAYFGFTADVNPAIGDTVNFTSAGNDDGFLVRLSQDLCSNMMLSTDFFVPISCSAPGVASVTALNGAYPYTYTWNTAPVVADSFIVFNASGIYQLTVTDSNACMRTVAFLLNAPDSLSSFDLNCNFVSTDFRPGFDATIWLNAFNNTCTPVNGSLMLVLDTLVSFDNAVPFPDVISGDTLTWSFSSLNYDAMHLTPQIHLFTDTAASIGDTLCFTAMITPVTGDADTANNVKTYCIPLINGYDPNDKKVYPAGTCTPGYVLNTQTLTYTVRFQNTGNAAAININVTDTLDADLDINSVRVVGSSHPLIPEVIPGQGLNFRFNNINLPDSTSDEPNSHGYVVYEVSPKATAPPGAEIDNKAYIYFDYNPAVITNSTRNTLIAVVPANCLSVDVDSPAETVTMLSIYPNPASASVTVSTKQPTEICIINLLGETVMRKKISGETVIDISAFSSGIYFIRTQDGSTQKLIRQ